MNSTIAETYAHPGFGSLRITSSDYNSLMGQYVQLCKAQQAWLPVPAGWSCAMGHSLQSILSSSYYRNQVAPQRTQIEARIKQLLLNCP
jgi:hypothetical protein